MKNKVKSDGSSVQLHRAGSKYILAALLTVVFVLIVWVICIVFNSLVTVKEISVNGESMYTPEQIIAASGIEPGAKKNKIDIAAVEQKILESMSFLSGAEVKIKANGKAIINITSEEISYCTNIAGRFYVMSNGFKILGLPSEVADRSDAVIIELPKVKKAIIGSVAEFYEDTQYIDVFLKSLNDSFLSDNIMSVDVSDKYDLGVVYNDNYFIDFGDSKNLAKKIDKVQIAINSDAIKNMTKVLIDVSDVSNPTIKPVN